MHMFLHPFYIKDSITANIFLPFALFTEEYLGNDSVSIHGDFFFLSTVA